jgi:hypothetical protein
MFSTVTADISWDASLFGSCFPVLGRTDSFIWLTSLGVLENSGSLLEL